MVVASEQVGNGDLRYQENLGGGFLHVVLRDADDGDVIIIDEDTIVALHERLGRSIEEHNLKSR